MKWITRLIIVALIGLGLLEIVNGWAPSFPRAWALLLAGLTVWVVVAGIRAVFRSAVTIRAERPTLSFREPPHRPTHEQSHHSQRSAPNETAQTTSSASQAHPHGEFEITLDDPNGQWMKDWRGRQ
ncbi:MAG: hypothetical protein AWU57_494 [Marinobacter sp. T13-3]|nr:MAG: hypothetical protein AWU57_494 [Marinobacter sp. T13-3]